MKLKIYLLAVSLVVAVVGAPQSVAASSALSMSIRQTPRASETLLTLYGNLTPNRSGTTVKIQVDTNGEKRLWEKLSSLQMDCIFDVGALYLVALLVSLFNLFVRIWIWWLDQENLKWKPF